MGDAVTPFGDWLRAEVDRRGWSISEFARRAGVAPQTAWRWVRGIHVPDAEYWPGIAHALGMSLDVIANAARGFSLTQNQSGAGVDQQLRQLMDDQSRLLRYLEEVQAVPKGVAVPILGYIPADTFREVSTDGQGSVEMLESDLRGARSPYALIATGDCMMREGIVTGTIVILDRPDGRDPVHNQIVAVRVNQDEYTLKRWVIVDGQPELHDGDGQLVYRLNPLDEIDIIGFYITHKPSPIS